MLLRCITHLKEYSAIYCAGGRNWATNELLLHMSGLKYSDQPSDKKKKKARGAKRYKVIMGKKEIKGAQYNVLLGLTPNYIKT